MFHRVPRRRTVASASRSRCGLRAARRPHVRDRTGVADEEFLFVAHPHCGRGCYNHAALCPRRCRPSGTELERGRVAPSGFGSRGCCSGAGDHYGAAACCRRRRRCMGLDHYNRFRVRADAWRPAVVVCWIPPTPAVDSHADIGCCAVHTAGQVRTRRASMSELKVDGAVKRFGFTRALDGVTLEAGAGITGLLGPNGAGKTTLLRVAATVLALDSGSIEILGLDPRSQRARLEIRRRLGYMPQEPGFHRNFTTFEFIDYVGILKEMTKRSSRHAEVDRVIELTGLTKVAHRKIKTLSGGMRRRVALAQALLGEPPLLVLDEPTAGLDPEQRLRFREVISRLGEERVILLSTHQTEDVAALCPRVAVMNHGKLLFCGTPRELAAIARGSVWLSEARVLEARLSWRTGDGLHRNIGVAPDAARLVEPTVEDGYLLLLGDEAFVEAA